MLKKSKRFSEPTAIMASLGHSSLAVRRPETALLPELFTSAEEAQVLPEGY